MSDYVSVAGGLEVAQPLHEFICTELLGDTGDADRLFEGFARIVRELAPENARLLARRDELQRALDAYHAEAANAQAVALGAPEYQAFLRQVGYLAGAAEPAAVATGPVDREIASVSGVQLVVPCDNPRYALNAANARWLSLLDALYGTDAILPNPAPTELPLPGGVYNAVRGGKVFDFCFSFLDRCFGCVSVDDKKPVSFRSVSTFRIKPAALGARATLEVTTGAGEAAVLRESQQLRGFTLKSDGEPREVVLQHHGLHVILCFDAARAATLGQASGLSDVVVESALTAICDFEDSVAAVDVDDKVNVYRTWAGLMRGDLCTTFQKGGRAVERRLKADRVFQSADVADQTLTLPGRAVLMCRNVGMQMQTDMIRLPDAGLATVPEAFVDLLVSAQAATFDLRKAQAASEATSEATSEAGDAGKAAQAVRNSRAGSAYIVKPKMHGPEEVAFNNTLFQRMEVVLGLTANTLKVGVMDEERRTSMTLAACMAEVRERLVFINTGFLDRTGDEIHTAMHAGPVLGKRQMRHQPWLGAYEDGNVDAGVAMQLHGKGQIGKGMWAKPDAMAAMLHEKVAHPRTGANTAWVPSPTAACLHALHYFAVSTQECLKRRAGGSWVTSGAPPEGLFCTPVACSAEAPLATKLRALGGDDAVRSEVREAAQAILGYVSRWVQLGLGCSKVPNLQSVELMEDRATLRINAQLLANWRLHGILKDEDLLATFREMAQLVDSQNAGDAAYESMVPEGEVRTDGGKGHIAFETSLALVHEGCAAPNGYTEAVLHEGRKRVKHLAAA